MKKTQRQGTVLCLEEDAKTEGQRQGTVLCLGEDTKTGDGSLSSKRKDTEPSPVFGTIRSFQKTENRPLSLKRCVLFCIDEAYDPVGQAGGQDLDQEADCLVLKADGIQRLDVLL